MRVMIYHSAAHFFEKTFCIPFSAVIKSLPWKQIFRTVEHWLLIPPRTARGTLKSSIVNLSTPKGITVDEAAALLRYSTSTVRRLISAHILVAWKPGGPAGRKYLIDEISLAHWQAESIRRAREEASTTQAALLQGELPLVW